MMVQHSSTQNLNILYKKKKLEYYINFFFLKSFITIPQTGFEPVYVWFLRIKPRRHIFSGKRIIKINLYIYILYLNGKEKFEQNFVLIRTNLNHSKRGSIIFFIETLKKDFLFKHKFQSLLQHLLVTLTIFNLGF